MSALAFFLCNGLVFLGAAWLARYGWQQPKGVPRALATAVLGWAWITLGMQGLGILGLLQVGCLLGWSAIPVMAGFWARRKRASAANGLEPLREREPIGWEGWAAVFLTVWVALYLGAVSLLLPVKVVSDGPIYHLYFAARWWKAGRLFFVASPFGESAATYFPANGDLWFTWLMATWGGDRLARIGQAPFLLMASLAAYGAARELGAKRTSSLIATSLFATGGPLILFSLEANVDTIFTAGYLAAAYFFLRYSLGRDGRGALLLGGLAAGCALGTKTVGNLFLPPLLLVAFSAVVVREKRRIRPTLRGMATILAGTAATSAFWFIRNALTTGNPLYPLNVKLAGTPLLAGWYGPDAMRQSMYYIPVEDWRALGDILVGVLDARTVPLWLAAVLGGWAIGRRRSRMDRWVWGFAFLAVLNIALYWLFIPYRTQQRFMLQGVGLAVVPLARLLDRGRWLSVAATFLVALHILTPQSWPAGPDDADVPWDLTPIIRSAAGAILPLDSRLEKIADAGAGLFALILVSLDILLLAVVAGLLVWIGSNLDRNGPRKFVGLGAVLAMGIAMLVGWIQTSPLAGDPRYLFFPAFLDFHRGWMELDARSGPKGSIVAYAGTNIPYYLMGVGVRNEVRYINTNGPREWQMHDYHRRALAEGRGEWPNSRPGWDRERHDFQEWLANLRAEKVQLLVVTKVNPHEGPHNVADAEGFPIERQWADSHPDVFEPLYGPRENDPWFRLYRVRSVRSAG